MKRYITITFIVAEAVLYIVFMSMDLLSSGVPTIALKYIGILLCLLFSFLCAGQGGEKLIPWAQLFTAAADFFLLVINNFYIIGILFFLVVQFIYLFYIYKKAERVWIPVRIAGLALVVVIVSVSGLFGALNLLAGIYFSLIVINMIMSWAYGKKTQYLFALGLTLFVCCDICVGTYNLQWAVPAALYEFTGIGMWMFYLPSQVLISLSMLRSIEKQ